MLSLDLGGLAFDVLSSPNLRSCLLGLSVFGLQSSVSPALRLLILVNSGLSETFSHNATLLLWLRDRWLCLLLWSKCGLGMILLLHLGETLRLLDFSVAELAFELRPSRHGLSLEVTLLQRCLNRGSNSLGNTKFDLRLRFSRELRLLISALKSPAAGEQILDICEEHRYHTLCAHFGCWAPKT